MHLREDAKFELDVEQRTELEKVVRSRRTAQAVAQRARIVLMTADGVLPGAIGEQLGVSQPRRSSALPSTADQRRHGAVPR